MNMIVTLLSLLVVVAVGSCLLYLAGLVGWYVLASIATLGLKGY